MARAVIQFSALFLVFAVVAVTQLSGVNGEVLFTDACLSCICQAASGCNPGIRCEGEVCGLYRITWAYWSDSGKPTLNGQSPDAIDAYPNCTNDPSCAARAVRAYMRRFAQDCNGDGVINCYDFMAIHKKGGYGCSGELPSQFMQVFNQCGATTSADNNMIDNNMLSIDVKMDVKIEMN